MGPLSLSRRWWAIAGLWSLVLAVSLTPQWRLVESKGLDVLAVLDPFVRPDPRIVLVGIDEPSFAELGLQWPWPREVHARLLERLMGAGAAVVGFDVLFVEASGKAADRRLVEAVRRAGNVVLAADEVVIEYPNAAQRARAEPFPDLLEAGAEAGLITVYLDADQVVRRLPDAPDAFWRVLARAEARRRGAQPPTIPAGLEAYIRYVSPTQAFPYASYYQALDPQAFLPADFFRDRIVLVGLNLQAPAEPGARHADLFATPVFTLTGRLVPGVEVQANALNTALRGRALVPASLALQLVVLVGVAVLAAWAFHPWRPLGSGLRALAIVTVIVAGAWGGYRFADTWLPVLAPAAGVALTWGAEGALAFLEENALRRRIRDAFSRYVSPALVEQIIRDPARLRLGGERKAVTVLFTDLADFTRIAEALGPEEVVRLLTRYLTEIARIVMDSGGTVVKFLGDGMMALWGAPLDDPEHASHACQAAILMRERVAKLSDELVAAGNPALRMRIGVHSGDAVIGHMGSEERFDYTATGDTVNLASRLESANKIYRTAILVSDATARAAGESVAFRRVDLVRVKGKTQAIEVFTPETNTGMVDDTETAIAAFRKGDWDRAEGLWQRLADRQGEDGVAQYYLERIASLRQTPPPPDWDGSLTLDTK